MKESEVIKKSDTICYAPAVCGGGGILVQCYLNRPSFVVYTAIRHHTAQTSVGGGNIYHSKENVKESNRPVLVSSRGKHLSWAYDMHVDINKRRIDGFA